MNEIEVSQLYIYPIKSLRGISLSRADICTRGFCTDRNWMLVDGEYKFLTQRQQAKLSLIDVRIDGRNLVVSTKGMQDIMVPSELQSGEVHRVKVWGDHCLAIKAPTAINQWFQDFLGIHCFLVHMPNSTRRIVDQEYAIRPSDQVGFADAMPFLLISEESLTALNERLKTKGHESIPMRRFRPNIVVKGCSAHAEDEWKKFSIGKNLFHAVKPCSRCVVTTIDPDTGIKGVEPLQTLMEYRKKSGKIYFGQNLVHDWNRDSADIKTICLGDMLRVLI